MAKKKGAKNPGGVDQSTEGFLRWSRRYGEILKLADWGFSVELYYTFAAQRHIIVDLAEFTKNAAKLFSQWEPLIIKEERSSAAIVEVDLPGRRCSASDVPPDRPTFAATAHGAAVDLLSDFAVFSLGNYLKELEIDVKNAESWTPRQVAKLIKWMPIEAWNKDERQRLAARMARERMLATGIPDPIVERRQEMFGREKIEHELGISDDTLRRYLKGAGIEIPAGTGPKGPIHRYDLIQMLEYLEDETRSKRVHHSSREKAESWLASLRG